MTKQNAEIEIQAAISECINGLISEAEMKAIIADVLEVFYANK